MTAAWIATVLICAGAFAYAMYLGRRGEHK